MSEVWLNVGGGPLGRLTARSNGSRTLYRPESGPANDQILVSSLL